MLGVVRPDSSVIVPFVGEDEGIIWATSTTTAAPISEPHDAVPVLVPMFVDMVRSGVSLPQKRSNFFTIPEFAQYPPVANTNALASRR